MSEELEIVDEDDFDDDDELEDEEEDAPGGFDLSSLLASAQQMQQQLVEAQQQVAAQAVEGQAGGGAVRIGLTGGFEFTGVTIDPSAVDPADVEMLQDLVLAALRDAVAKVNELNASAMSSMQMGGLGGALGGLLS